VIHVVSSFTHSEYLELALTSLEQSGISKEHILAVALDKRKEKPHFFDTIRYSDGISLFDAAMAWSTVFAVIFSCYGYILTWGPIIWGLIGVLFGFIFGFLIDLLIHRRRRNLRDKSAVTETEVFVMVECPERMAAEVERIFWDHFALGVAQIAPGHPTTGYNK
jgi:hypothetical protein